MDERRKMDNILRDLGLVSVIDLFQINNIQPKDVLSLKDEEFRMLGITAIGDKVRLREKCKDIDKADRDDSPVLKRLEEFQKQRKSRRVVNNRKPKDTRRIHVGWKRFTKNSYQLVSENKGGGIHIIDVSKYVTLQELTNVITEKYFPNGLNVSSGTALKDLSFFIATFTGKELSNTLECGKPFTLGQFLEEFNSSPVRLYLHTKLSSLVIEGVVPNECEATNKQICYDSDSSLPDPLLFQDTDTPTVKFKRKRKLHLRRSMTTTLAQTVTSPEPGPSGSNTNSSLESGQLDFNIDSLETGTNNSSLEPTCRPSGSNTDSFQLSAVTVVPEPMPPSNIILHAPTEVTLLDVDLQATIRESLENAEPEEKTLQGILKWWKLKTYIPEALISDIVIQRDKVLKCTMRVVNRPLFNYLGPFKVTYSGETGDDLGGPKREYLRELMQEIQTKIMEGSERNKFFKHDVDLLHSRTYENCGKLVAWSVLHGGPGIPVLNKHLFDLMMGKEAIEGGDINCVVDSDVRAHLLEILDTTTEKDLQEAIQKHGDWLIEQGFTRPANSIKINDKESLLMMLMKQEIYYRVHSEISQFVCGMDQIGNFTQAVAKAPDAMKCLFVDECVPLTLTGLREMYHINFSPEGSNQRSRENNVIYCLEAFLADCEAGILEISLSDVLVFWTGASSPPPLGFDTKLKIFFTDSPEKRFPVAHTCSLQMDLWRGYSDPDDFRDDIMKAIKWGGGFYLA